MYRLPSIAKSVFAYAVAAALGVALGVSVTLMLV